MPEQQSPATAKRRLRKELRTLRERANLSQNDVVDKFKWSLSKLIRIENGSVGVSITDVMALSSIFKVSDSEREELIALAVIAKESRWWDKYRHVVPPQLQQFLGFEADAVSIRVFHPMVIPGLLQVRGYIEAVGTLMLQQLGAEETKELFEVRALRKRHVLEGTHPPRYTALIDESVLHRRVGGAEVMKEQIAYLTKLIRQKTIQLGILPYAKGAHFGMTGGFHIMEFEDGNVDDAVLYLENAHNSVALEDKGDLISQYGQRFDEMMSVSIQGEKAIRFLKDVDAKLSS